MSLSTFLFAIIAALLSGLTPSGMSGRSNDAICQENVRSKDARNTRSDRKIAAAPLGKSNDAKVIGSGRRYLLM